MSSIKILATGSDFLKEGVRGTGPVVEEIMEHIDDELHILAYVISKHAVKFLDLIERAIESGVKTTLVINKLEEQDDEVKEKLRKWKNKFPYFNLVDFNRKGKTLHAKVVVVDRTKAVIGSANFSWGGMSGNYEIGILLEGRDAWTLSRLVDDVADSTEN